MGAPNRTCRIERKTDSLPAAGRRRARRGAERAFVGAALEVALALADAAGVTASRPCARDDLGALDVRAGPLLRETRMRLAFVRRWRREAPGGRRPTGAVSSGWSVSACSSSHRRSIASRWSAQYGESEMHGSVTLLSCGT